ncbi:ABC transporter ATP-binding protein [Microbispora bryophytorum]|uniref:ABC transporter ATP-binding protein n=1 Tax=Microbispora bryophytorum subsp. camponoti TaxID=1677852 RepID=A0ABR8LA07_9ACTN|nr:ABC transporter ATP-binding protein [Microbispora camponoti]MBD3146599.1 ABC transporter ATP-binding protein [Microbispora camponoti]
MAGTGKTHLREAGSTLLRVEDLQVEFPAKGGQRVHAVSGVSFDVAPGETVGFVGESGCGKSTVARAVMHLPAPNSGVVNLDDTELGTLSAKRLRETRVAMQLIFQDPMASLNPRRKVKDLVQEGVEIWHRGGDRHALEERTRELLDDVGLDSATVWNRYPHELSGGQCQRVSIARALMMRPSLLICDEILASLDVSVQSQMLNLLKRTRAEHGLAMMFISHDLGVVKNISDRILVMYLGKVAEVLEVDALDRETVHHPYTQLLLASVPRVTGERIKPSVDGAAQDLPSPLNPPSGCRFRTRCPLATDRCAQEEPQLEEKRPGQFIACHHVS